MYSADAEVITDAMPASNERERSGLIISDWNDQCQRSKSPLSFPSAHCIRLASLVEGDVRQGESNR